jgi:hypothetical protein
MEKAQFEEWMNQRASKVRSQYTAFDALKENGFGEAIPDQNTPTQISCPSHGPDKRPSARYYPTTGNQADYVHCYTCKMHADSIGLYSKFKGLKWYDALKDLERRFGIKVTKQPDGTPFQEPVSKTSVSYESEKWGDVPAMLELLESKLIRLRDKVIMTDFIKFCRVIDTVSWDLDHNQQVVTPAMIDILGKVYLKMNQAIQIASLSIDSIPESPD